MRKLPFIERNHGPVGDALDHVERQTRVTVGPVADYLARAHAVIQGIAAAARITRAQSPRFERCEPDLIAETTADDLIALAATSADMLAEQTEQLSQWIEVAALAGASKVSASSIDGKVSTDG